VSPLVVRPPIRDRCPLLKLSDPGASTMLR
jgi:hypothetical protein